MRIKQIIVFVILIVMSSPAFAARVSDACTQNSECSSDGRLYCEASNCLESGKFTITLAWNADTDLDLSVKTPSGLRIGAADAVEADSGRLTVDECYDAERCGASEHPHVEHVAWDFRSIMPLGRYHLDILNFDGRNAADYRVYVTRPDGHRFVLEGHVGADAGATSSETFRLLATTYCSDRDHDGLCDSWEVHGLDVDDDGLVDLNLPAMGADPDRKDIFVEVDWMPGARPYGLGLAVDAFAKSPVQNPDGSNGVTLHIDMSDEVATLGARRVRTRHEFDDEDLALVKLGRRDFDETTTSCNQGWFGSASDRSSENCDSIIRAKRMVYRYAIFAYKRLGTTSSGRGELPGDEMIVSTKSWRTNDQELENATFMHELGHTLGLFHGGSDNHNCKPNYLSLMNYYYQTDAAWAGRPLDYSRTRLATIDETALIEFEGVSGPTSWEQVAFQGPSGAVIVTDTDASQPIDWDQNGDLDVDIVSVHVSNGDECSQSGVARQLESHDDWGSLLYNFRLTGKFGISWGDDEPLEEMTEEQYERLARSSDSDVDGHNNLEDNCPSKSNPPQLDADGDGVGDACDACPQTPAPGYFDGCGSAVSAAPESPDPTEKADRASMPEPGFIKPGRGCASAGANAFWLALLAGLIGATLARRRRTAG